MFGSFQRKFFARYMDEAGDGTEGGAGGSGGSLTDEEKAAALAAAEAAKEKEGEGKSKISDAEAKLLKENLQKKAKLDELGKQLTQANEKLKEFEGLDAAAIRDLIAKQKADEEKSLEAKGDYERLKQRMADEHTKSVGGLQDQIAELTASLNAERGQVNELTIGSQFNNSTYIKDKLILTPSKAKALYSPHFDFVDGQVVGYDKPRGAASRTAFVDAVGAPLGFDQVMTKLIESDPEKDALLRSTVKPGAGSGSELPYKPKADGQEKSSLNKISDGLKGLKIS